MFDDRAKLGMFVIVLLLILAVAVFYFGVGIDAIEWIIDAYNL